MSTKCQACGAILPPFALKCPECGTAVARERESSKEIRDEIRDLQIRLAGISDVKERAMIVSTFSVPNTQEGLMNLLIFSANQFKSVNGQEDIAIASAWLGKAKQAYSLLKVQAEGDPGILSQLQAYAWLDGEVKVLHAEDTRRKRKRIRLVGILAAIVLVVYLFLLIVSHISVEEEPENVRAAVLELIQDGKYDEARIKAAEAEYSWERDELMEMIDRASK